jgi:hypothetical protein
VVAGVLLSRKKALVRGFRLTVLVRGRSWYHTPVSWASEG